MILKEYQKRAVATVGDFVEGLARWRREDEAARKQNPDWGVDWVGRAWRDTGIGRPYRARRTGVGDPLPAFCLKIPTGGGKTLLATRVIDLVNGRFLHRRRGLVLWIVPTTQIYNQTLGALKDRDHPYRQQLDLSSGQRTRVFEKTTAFGPRDVKENLCILLLMLPSANRKTKDRLRMYRDAGGFDRFFPSEDRPAEHAELLRETPNLDTFEGAGGVWGRQVKTSLGNTLRLLRPLIILDEGHKAYSVNAKKTLEGFNPSMIVELSATPAAGANVLVDIRGQELNAEEMIKLDLHIRNRGPHPAHLRDSGGADREGAAQARPDPRRGRSRVPGPASGDPAPAHRGEDQREGRAPGGGRHRRPDVAPVPDPVHHHQAGAAGGLGLPVRVRPDDPHEPVVAHRDHAARGSHSAAAPRQEDGQSVARRELRLLLQAKGPRAAGGGQAGLRAGGAPRRAGRGQRGLHPGEAARPD